MCPRVRDEVHVQKEEEGCAAAGGCQVPEVVDGIRGVALEHQMEVNVPAVGEGVVVAVGGVGVGVVVSRW